MARDRAHDHDVDDGIALEWVDTDAAASGTVVAAGSTLRHRRLWAAVGVLAIAGAAVATATWGGPHDLRPAAHSTSSLAPPSSAAASSVGPGARSKALPSAGLEPRYTQIGRPLVPGGTGTDLFVLTDQFLVRYELDAGRITRTIAPSLSTAPTFLIANGPDVLVRPYDFEPGYAIKDDGERNDLTGRLADGAFGAFPTSDPDRVWIFDHDGGERVAQFTMAGAPTGVTVPTPGLWAIGSDGAGRVLLRDARTADDSTYVADEKGVTVLSHDQLLAIGPTAAVVRHCVTNCPMLVIDRTSGRVHDLGVQLDGLSEDAYGLISPDGRFAAFDRLTAKGHELHVFDLVDGRDQLVGPIERWSTLVAAAAWSPDGRWLVYVNRERGLTADDPVGARQVLIDPGTTVLAMVTRPSPHA